MDSESISDLCLLSLDPGGEQDRHRGLAQPGHHKHGHTGFQDKDANSGWWQHFCASLFLHVDHYFSGRHSLDQKCRSPSNSPRSVLNTNHVIRVTCWTGRGCVFCCHGRFFGGLKDVITVSWLWDCDLFAVTLIKCDWQNKTKHVTVKQMVQQSGNSPNSATILGLIPAWSLHVSLKSLGFT